MNVLVDELAKSFDECLDSILSDPQQQQKEVENDVLDTQTKLLKTTFLELENHLRQLRLNALADRPLAIKEANVLLQRDIQIKNNMIQKYVTKLDEWESKIPSLIENGKQAVALRTDGTDFDPHPDAVIARQRKLQEQETAKKMALEKSDNDNKDMQNNNEDDDDDDDDDDVQFEEL